jgi:hypothetical protein
VRRIALALASLSLLPLVAVSVAPSRAVAQDNEPRIIETSLTPAEVTVGDRLTLRIVVEHADGVTIEGPRFGENFGGLEIVEAPPPQRGATRTTIEYTLAAFAIGDAALPALEVRWRGEGGAGSLTTEPQSVTVRSVLSPGDDALRPLKPQLSLADDAPPAIVPLAFVMVFVLLTILGYWLLRRAVASRPVEPAPVDVPLTAAERARAALDALAAAGELDARDHYARLAEVVRGYLSERFGFPGYAMTRREMERGMARAGIDRFVARVTTNLLEQCDAVQFAGFRPPGERVDADLTAAYEVVRMTEPETPSEDAVEAEAVGQR